MIDLYLTKTKMTYINKSKYRKNYFKPTRYSNINKNKEEISSFIKDGDFL